MATTIEEIASDDLLMIEAKIQRGIWVNITACCGKDTRCKLVCPIPCRKVKKIINRYIPMWFMNYVKWN